MERKSRGRGRRVGREEGSWRGGEGKRGREREKKEVERKRVGRVGRVEATE